MRLFRLNLVNEAAGCIYINPKKILSVEARAGQTCYITSSVLSDPNAAYREPQLMGYHVDESLKSLLKRLEKHKSRS